MTGPAFVPELLERLPLLDNAKPLGGGPPDPASMAAFEAFNAPVEGYEVPQVEVVDTVAPGPHGDIPVRVYRSAGSTPTHGLVWCHGGAFIFGDLDMPESDTVARELAARRSMVVVAVDYRLCSPNVHFPVPHDDVHAAFVWAATNSELLPDGSRWSIGGASAGGNLAAGVTQRLVGEPEAVAVPASVVLAYPVLHHDLPESTPEHAARVESLPAILSFPAGARAWINATFLGGADPDVPYAFAALGDVTRFPPTFMTLADHDDLAPSGHAFAQQLAEAGVRVEVEMVEGVPHGHLNVGGLPAARASISAMADFMEPMPS